MESTNTPDAQIPDDEVNLFPDDEISHSNAQVEESKSNNKSPEVATEIEKMEIAEPEVSSAVKDAPQPGPSTSKSMSETNNKKKSTLPDIGKISLGSRQSQQKKFEGQMKQDRKEAYRTLTVLASDKQKTRRNNHLALATLRDADIDMVQMFSKSDVTSIMEFRNFYNQLNEKQIVIIHKKTKRVSKPMSEKIYILFEEKDLMMVAGLVIFEARKGFQFGDVNEDIKGLINMPWSEITTTQVKPMEENEYLVYQVMSLIIDNHKAVNYRLEQAGQENDLKMKFLLKFANIIMQYRSEAS